MPEEHSDVTRCGTKWTEFAAGTGGILWKMRRFSITVVAKTPSLRPFPNQKMGVLVMNEPAADVGAIESPAADMTSSKQVPIEFRAFLLNQIASAPEGILSNAAANKRLPRGLSKAEATRLRKQLAFEGLLDAEGPKRSPTFRLTTEGDEELQAIKAHVPELNTGGTRLKLDVDQETQDWRRSLLLFTFLKKDVPLTNAEANRDLNDHARKGLELNAATANHLREEAASKGYLEKETRGRSVRYALTAPGLQQLAQLPVYGVLKVRLKGDALNRLLEAAREVARSFEPASRRDERAAEPVEVEAYVLSTIETLRRERHQYSGMVPIHEIRAEVQRKFGAAAASHAQLDPLFYKLHREKRLHLLSIADHSKATQEQLQESITGVGEVLFYCEAANDHAIV